MHIPSNIDLESIRSIIADRAISIEGYPSRFDLSEVKSITPDALEFLGSNLPPDSELILNGLEGVSTEVAHQLLAFPCSIMLDGLVSLDPDVARILVRCEGVLSLNGIKRLTKELIEALSARINSAKELQLRGLTHIDKQAATLLVGCSEDVYLDNVSEIDVDTARVLASCRGRLSLNGLVAINSEAWNALTVSNNYDPLEVPFSVNFLSINGLKAIPDDCFSELRSDIAISLNGIANLSVSLAETLSRNNVSVSLAGLRSISDEAALKLFGGASHLTLSGLTELPPTLAIAMSRHKGKIDLGGVRVLGEEAASAIASGSCEPIFAPDCCFSDKSARQLMQRFPRLFDNHVNYALGSAGGEDVCVGYCIDEGYWPIHLAILLESDDLLRRLLDIGVDPNVTSKYGTTALHLAAISNRCDRISMLLKSSVKIDSADQWGCTALHLAAERGYVSAVELLRSSDCLLRKDLSGMKPAVSALVNGHKSLFDLLYADSQIESCDFALSQPLGVDDKSDVTPIHWVSMTDKADLLSKLLKNGFDINMHAGNGGYVIMTPLANAVRNNRLEVAEILLSAGANPNPFSDYLSLFDFTENEKMQLLLLKGGADPYIRIWDESLPIDRLSKNVIRDWSITRGIKIALNNNPKELSLDAEEYKSIQSGDVVVLKSGGPEMFVVDWMNKSKVLLCAWINKNGEYKESLFPGNVLVCVSMASRFGEGDMIQSFYGGPCYVVKYLTDGGARVVCDASDGSGQNKVINCLFMRKLQRSAN